MSLEEKLDLKNKEIIKKLKIKSSLTEIISPNNFFSKEFREYNINGNDVKKYAFIFFKNIKENKESKHFFIHSYLYDSNENNVSSQTNHTYNEFPYINKTIILSKTINKYNSDNLLIESIKYNQDNKIESIINRYYDHKNLIKDTFIIKFDSLNSEMCYNSFYTYDSKNKLIKIIDNNYCHYRIINKIEPCETEETSFAYDTKNNLIKTVKFNNEGKTKSTFLYEYDTNESLIKSTKYENNEILTTNYQYDSNELLIGKFIYNVSNNETTEISKIDYFNTNEIGFTKNVDLLIPINSEVKDNSNIIVKFISKKFFKANYQVLDQGDYINFNLKIKNNYPKILKGFKGELTFIDLFDQEILTTDLSVEKIIKSSQTINWECRLIFDQFLNSHQKLLNSNGENIKTNFKLKKVIFNDGTIQTF